MFWRLCKNHWVHIITNLMKTVLKVGLGWQSWVSYLNPTFWLHTVFTKVLQIGECISVAVIWLCANKNKHIHKYRKTKINVQLDSEKAKRWVLYSNTFTQSKVTSMFFWCARIKLVMPYVRRSSQPGNKRVSIFVLHSINRIRNFGRECFRNDATTFKYNMYFGQYWR